MKLRSLVVLLALLLSFTSSQLPVGALAGCQCTDYCHEKRPELPALGDAQYWAVNAVANRYSVGTLPSAGAVVVFQPRVQWADSTFGHVAYVERSNSESSYYLSEKNWGTNPCAVHYRDAATDTGTHRNGRVNVQFIYRPITYDRAVNGTIERSYTKDRWGFYASANDRITIRLNRQAGSSLDPFVYLRAPSGRIEALDDDAGGNLNSLISNHRLAETGGYVIEAAGWSNRTGSYQLTVERGSSTSSNGNLALGRPVTASSTESGSYQPSKAVDGNQSSRWSSRHGGRNEWLYVDLGGNKSVRQINLHWETAYANRYWLAYFNENDGNWWGWLAGGDGGWDRWTLGAQRRWWLMLEDARPGRWSNISLFEFEIYERSCSPAREPLAISPEEHTTLPSDRPVSLGSPAVLPSSVAARCDRIACEIPELKRAIEKARQK